MRPGHFFIYIVRRRLYEHPRNPCRRGRGAGGRYDAGTIRPRQNKSVVVAGKGVSERLDAIESKLDAHVTMDDRRNADGHRTRILHFNNELLREIDHTKEEFIEVLAEIDAYERYCEEHPEYPNNRAVLAIENIREVYKDRLKKHDFLQEGSSPRREAEE